MDFAPIHFFDQPIEVIFDEPFKLEKNPDVPPNRVIGLLASWTDFKRRGRMARNMQPQHAAVASTRGSLNVGRYYFRVCVLSSSSTAGQTQDQIFDIYYDRAMKNVDDRKDQWFVYREMEKVDGTESNAGSA